MAKKDEPKKEKNILLTVGKRKRAIARARFRPGSGRIFINATPLEFYPDEIIKMRIEEPLLLIGNDWKKFDVKINVVGGGISGQADAIRQALARGYAELLGKKVKEIYLNYDRNLLVYDPRRTEPHKPPHSSWGPRRYKQRSKR